MVCIMDSDRQIVEQAIAHTRKQLRHCPRCIQHDPDFIKKYPDNGNSLFVFSSSPAFKYNGRWYHLVLIGQDPKYKGGFRWSECDEPDHHEILAILTGHTYTLSEAVTNACAQLKVING